MEFIESPTFTAAVANILTEEELFELQDTLVENPEAGDIIPGSKGLRKIRVKIKNKGKQGGARVIYYWYVSPERIDLLRIYKKNNKSDIPKKEVKKILTELHR